MKIATIQAITINNYQSKNNTKKITSNPSFSAWRYPSGNYSNWFVRFIKQELKLSDTKYFKRKEQFLKSFRANVLDPDDSAIFAIGARMNIKKDMDIRLTDYSCLADDLRNHRRGRYIGKQPYDDPYREFNIQSEQYFSSETDYNRRHLRYENPESIETYEELDSPADFAARWPYD